MTYIIAIVAMMALVGCHDFLDKPEHDLTPEMELDNISSVSASIYSSFRGMSSGQGHAVLARGEVASDNAPRGGILSGSGGTDAGKQFNQFQNFVSISAVSTNFINQLWNGLYPVISQANVNVRAIARLFPDESEQTQNAYIAENRVMRSWVYIFLVNTFGQIPIIPEDDLTPAEYAELTNDLTVLELYDYIIEDLRFAVEWIPSKSEWYDNYGMPWQGRHHLGTAQGLLAKALLYKAANEIYFNSDTEAAKECYEEIVEIVTEMYPDYSLADDFEAIFRESGNYSAESIMEIGTASTTDGTTAYEGFEPVQPRDYYGATGLTGPTINLINQYERGADGEIEDLRYRGTVVYGRTTPLSGMEHPEDGTDFMRMLYDVTLLGTSYNTGNVLANGWPNRWNRKTGHKVAVTVAGDTSSGSSNYGDNNLKMLRWGEVLMIGAEAAYHAGNEVQALAWLQKVRDRAGLTTKDVSTLTGQDLLDQIWADKRLEIALEWSNRYFELVRIDKLNSGYFDSCMDAKVNDEFNGIKDYLDSIDGWFAIYSESFPITSNNYRSMIPLSNGLSTPKHYTMPIPSDVFQEMFNVIQTPYYR